MAVTLASFKVRFPEFIVSGAKEVAHDTMLQAYIDAALMRTPTDPWGTYRDEGTLYLAAHLLAVTPFGQNAKLASKVGDSVYGVEYKRLQRIVTAGRGRVTGYKESDLELLG